MRLVVPTETGVLELNWQWLPTWIGINSALRQELQKDISSKIEGRLMTPAVIEEAHNLVVAFLVNRFPSIQGLDHYLDSLKYIEFSDENR